MSVGPNVQCVTVSMPKDLLKQLDDYCSQFPGLPRSTILKAMVVVGLDHKAKVRDAVGRY